MARTELAMQLAEHAIADAELSDDDGSVIAWEQVIVRVAEARWIYLLPQIETVNRVFQTASINITSIRASSIIELNVWLQIK